MTTVIDCHGIATHLDSSESGMKEGSIGVISACVVLLFL